MSVLFGPNPFFRDFPKGKASFISPRIGRTYPGPAPEAVGSVRTDKLVFSRHEVTT